MSQTIELKKSKYLFFGKERSFSGETIFWVILYYIASLTVISLMLHTLQREGSSINLAQWYVLVALLLPPVLLNLLTFLVDMRFQEMSFTEKEMAIIAICLIGSFFWIVILPIFVLSAMKIAIFGRKSHA